MPKQEVALKQVPAQPVASVRDVIPTYRDVGQLFGEIFAYLGQHRVSPAGPPATIYHEEEFREHDVDVEVVVPVAGPVPDGERVKARDLCGGHIASVVHQGGYGTIGGTYGQVMGWIEAHDYHIAGPPREIYLKGPESGDDPSTCVTEIQVPVAKA